jgi:hypothetical protein
MTGDFEKLAYDEAVRGLDKQEGLLEALRTRTGVLLASSFLAASLFGQRAVQDPGPRGLAISVLVAFVISMGAGVFILLPKRNLVFAAAAADFYAGFYDLRSDMAEVASSSDGSHAETPVQRRPTTTPASDAWLRTWRDSRQSVPLASSASAQPPARSP